MIRNFDMSRDMSKSFVLRRQGTRMKEVSKVQQGCLARGETKVVDLALT
jgi:hypothetical protein